MKAKQCVIFNVEIHRLMLSIIIKFNLHLSENDEIDDILSYLFFKKEFRDKHRRDRDADI